MACEHDTVTPVFWAVTVSASDRCKSDIKLRFIARYRWRPSFGRLPAGLASRRGIGSVRTESDINMRFIDENAVVIVHLTKFYERE